MAIKFTCDKCGKLFDDSLEMSCLQYHKPRHNNKLRIIAHVYSDGVEETREVEDMAHTLCNRCASEFLSHYLKMPVDDRG